MNRLGSTNGQIFKWDGVGWDTDRFRIVKGAVRVRFNELLSGRRVADPIKVFVKREPHKQSKIQEGRLRLISGVSLIDNLVDRILFGWMLRRALQVPLTTPCMIGWSPTRGGWRMLKAMFQNKPVTCMDKSSWDWTVTERMVRMALYFILKLPVNPPPWWERMVEARFELLFKDPVYQFPDGTQCRQPEVGIQKSGSLLTLILNSVWQSMMHNEVCYELGLDPDEDHPKTMGDDTLQVWQRGQKLLDEYARVMKTHGPVVKEARIQNWIEFAGFVVLGNSCIPAYWKKHLYNLRYASNPIETLQSYQILYSHHDEIFAWLERRLTSLKPGSAYPVDWCRSVMDFEA